MDKEELCRQFQLKFLQAMSLQLQVPKNDRYAPASDQVFESMIKGKVVRNVRTIDMTSAIPRAIINFTDGSSVEVTHLAGDAHVQYHPKSTFVGYPG
jgi:hypothetical protein